MKRVARPTPLEMIALFLASFLASNLYGAIEKIEGTIDSDLGAKLKEVKSISLVVLSIVGPDIFEQIENDGREFSSRDYPAKITANGFELLDGVIGYTSISGPQKWLSFKTKDRYLFLEFVFPDIDRSYSGVIDCRNVSTIEVRLVDEDFEVATFKRGRIYE